MRIEGYAAVFNTETKIDSFWEVIKPGAFDRALREQHDVRALVGHDQNQVLGRTKSKTLELRVDSKGLFATISPPDTQVGRDVVTSIKRGDLDGMSFAFLTLDDDWNQRGQKIVREVNDVELVDVSVVAYPAYEATSVAVRTSGLRTAPPLELGSRDYRVDQDAISQDTIERRRTRWPAIERCTARSALWERLAGRVPERDRPFPRRPPVPSSVNDARLRLARAAW